MTTAQACRYKVTDSGVELMLSEGKTGHITKMRHDQNLDGIPDADGADVDDSGGPCYFANSAGAIYVAGIVKSRSIEMRWWTGHLYHEYRCTQLSGVRAWNPLANVG